MIGFLIATIALTALVALLARALLRWPWGRYVPMGIILLSAGYFHVLLRLIEHFGEVFH